MRGTSKRALVLIAIPVLLSPLAACSKSDTASTTNSSAAGSGGSSTTAAGGSGGSAASGGAGTPVKAQLPQFDPQKVTVKAGGTVTFTSTDGKPHEPTAGTKDKPEEGVFDVTIAPNGTGSTPALKAGTIKYFCGIHPSMTGEITVS